MGKIKRRNEKKGSIKQTLYLKVEKVGWRIEKTGFDQRLINHFQQEKYDDDLKINFEG